MAWISSAAWQGLKNYIEDGRMDGLLVCDLPQIKGKRLTCLPGAGQGPVPGTSKLWGVGEGLIRQSLRGFTGSNRCSGLDLAS